MQQADFNRNLDELGYWLTLTPRQKATCSVIDLAASLGSG
jgi:hypothetical protein